MKLHAMVSAGRPAPEHCIIMQAERVENPSHVFEEQGPCVESGVEKSNGLQAGTSVLVNSRRIYRIDPKTVWDP